MLVTFWASFSRHIEHTNEFGHGKDIISMLVQETEE
jgi:hypothetical protein